MFCIIPIQAYQWMDLSLKFIIAAAASWIAFNQFKLAKDKLRFDLFEKRFAFYDNLYNLILFIVTSEPTYNYKEDPRTRKEAQFLFGKDMSNYIGELHNKINGLILHRLRSNSMNEAFQKTGRDHPDRMKEWDKAEEIRSALVKDLDRLGDLFQPYLGMDHRL